MAKWWNRLLPMFDSRTQHQKLCGFRCHLCSEFFFTQENNLVPFKNQKFRIQSLCGYRSIVYWENLMYIDSSGLLLITLSVYGFWRAVHKTYHLLTTSSHAHNVSSHKWRHCSLLGKCIILQWTNKQPQNVHKRWLKEVKALGVSREENGYSL